MAHSYIEERIPRPGNTKVLLNYIKKSSFKSSSQRAIHNCRCSYDNIEVDAW